MRVIVSGDREWKNEGVMYEAFDRLREDCLAISESHHNPVLPTIVEGCQRGADTMAERIAGMVYVWPLEHHPANWGMYGNAAGAIRNTEMLTMPGNIDLCLAFHPDLKRSKGTLDMVEKCLRAGIEVRLYPRS